MPKPPKEIRKDSSFADLRGLSRVEQSFVEVDEWPDEGPVDLSKVFDGLPEDHRLRRYFGVGQNDATIITGSFAHDELSLTFNHYDVWRLAGFAEVRGWQDSRHAFPCTMRFTGVNEFYPLRLVEHGRWQMIQRSRRRVFRNLADVGHLEMRSFTEGSVVAILHLRGDRCYKRQSKLKDGWYHNEYKLCVNAKSVVLEENYRDGWITHCGDSTLPLLDAFESVWPVPLWAEPDFLEWIEKNG